MEQPLPEEELTMETRKSVPISEGQMVILLGLAVNGRCLDLEWGIGRVALTRTPGNQWALDLLEKARSLP